MVYVQCQRYAAPNASKPTPRTSQAFDGDYAKSLVFGMNMVERLSNQIFHDRKLQTIHATSGIESIDDVVGGAPAADVMLVVL